MKKESNTTMQQCNKQNVNHRFLTMKNTHDWGISMLYMEESGKAFARTYWYFDDESTIYFDWLNVIETARGNGIATELLNIHLKTADDMKMESCLSVKKETWMHEWYKRKGYKDLKDDDNESNNIWMNLLPQNGG
jgi:GNAT superfamily N-acetyltransferase